ncbi:DyP [Coprinopsis cinerea okayama7|uniref:DyP n=1 Tax=Coprinopsis cinerea (strain Okayama-7 / 130 / ATCC MYA-4618 / FGSC 9003) TaxID=240176 RepID=A8NBN3_COPC7|nr:DyP [Coprinopsis cinerea okayama7\|eukprot:XP_001832231.1 DyP [Coprinopsis cinerea okayama7\
MTRPTLTNINGASFTVVVPPGWFTTVSAISRRTYNQLVTCAYKVEGDTRAEYLANQWGNPNQAMRDTTSSMDSIAIIPQDETVTMDFSVYHHTRSNVSGEDLESPKYRSNRINVLTSEKPANAPQGFPDYVTFAVMVEDGSVALPPSSPEYDDVVIAINVMEGGANPGGDPKPKPSPYNLPNIQGDILPAMPKALEHFYYFRITNLPVFRKVMKDFVIPKITTADKLVNDPPPPINPRDPNSFKYPWLGVNVGFTHLAMRMFGLSDNLGDIAYEKGQQQDSKELGDAGTQRGNFWTPSWDGAFKEDIHGIFLIVAYNNDVAQKFIDELEAAFKYTPSRSAIHKVVKIHGFPRPEPEDRNDHFGYRGGMSNPQVAGVTFKDKMRYPGSPLIPMGVIVMGYDGDEDKDKRPAWAKDGAFMVTRKLNNLVPEFDDFLLQHGPRIFPELKPQEAADKLGARLFGRWKNGTPTELSPDHNDPDIAKDDNRINNFTFDQSKGQSRCPFASHMRKSNPRNDVSPVESAFKHFVRRHNMPYGPEITDEEKDGNGTIYERGLHVVCYQSSIVRGFKFIQEGWYNDPNFPPNKPVTPGLDPIFGQTGKEEEGDHRSMSGANPTLEQEIMTFPHKFIDPRGGEYFFSPSISTLKTYIAA